MYKQRKVYLFIHLSINVHRLCFQHVFQIYEYFYDDLFVGDDVFITHNLSNFFKKRY